MAAGEELHEDVVPVSCSNLDVSHRFATMGAIRLEAEACHVEAGMSCVAVLEEMLRPLGVSCEPDKDAVAVFVSDMAADAVAEDAT